MDANSGGLVLLVVVLGLNLLLLLHDRLLALDRPEQRRARVRVLVRPPLPALAHLQPDGSAFSSRKGMRDLQAFSRKATIACARRDIVRHSWATPLPVLARYMCLARRPVVPDPVIRLAWQR